MDLIIGCLDRNKNNKDKCMFVIYIHANAINNNKGNAGSGEQTAGLAMDFSIKVCQPILVILQVPLFSLTTLGWLVDLG